MALDAEAVLDEFAKIARANVLDYIEFNERGEPTVDLSRLDRAQAAALSEVAIEECAAGTGGRPATRRIRFRMHDKLAALDKLARHFGLLRERAPDVGRTAFDEDEHDPRQVARAVIAILESAAMAEEAARGGEAAGAAAGGDGGTR